MPEVDAGPELGVAVFRKALEATTDGVLVTDASRADQPVLYVNPGFERMTGYRADEVLGRSCRFLEAEERAQPERSKLKRALTDGLPCTVVLKDFRKDGSLFWNELSLAPVRDRTGKATHVLWIQKDVTARMRMEKTIQEQQEQLAQANRSLARVVTHDPLTDVAHRRFFLEMLTREWKRAAREGVPVALVLVDVDALRAYNDLYGHEAGDDCLKRVASALESVLKRPADLLGRYEGEEFAALLPGTDRKGALQVAEAMRAAVGQLEIDQPGSRGAERLSVSVGLATVFPGPEIAMQELIARSESALRAAKEAGRNRVQVFVEPELADLPPGL